MTNNPEQQNIETIVNVSGSSYGFSAEEVEQAKRRTERLMPDADTGSSSSPADNPGEKPPAAETADRYEWGVMLARLPDEPHRSAMTKHKHASGWPTSNRTAPSPERSTQSAGSSAPGNVPRPTAATPARKTAPSPQTPQARPTKQTPSTNETTTTHHWYMSYGSTAFMGQRPTNWERRS